MFSEDPVTQTAFSPPVLATYGHILAVCVLSHTEGPPTQLMSTVRAEMRPRSATDSVILWCNNNRLNSGGLGTGSALHGYEI